MTTESTPAKVRLSDQLGHCALPEPDFLLDGGRLRCYYGGTVARLIAARRQPLTDEQIDALVLDSDGLPNSHLEFARAIEMAHGIGGLSPEFMQAQADEAPRLDLGA